jgi:hypothetical protein
MGVYTHPGVVEFGLYADVFAFFFILLAENAEFFGL